MPPKCAEKTPEDYLRDYQAEEEATIAANTGHLKIILGYASGVRKSFRMLDEGRRGQDVIIGAIQPEVSPEVELLLRKLEVTPLKTVNCAGASE